MRIMPTSPHPAGPLDQLAGLNALLAQALTDSDELRHRIREIQLRVKELTAAVQKREPHEPLNPLNPLNPES